MIWYSSNAIVSICCFVLRYDKKKKKKKKKRNKTISMSVRNVVRAKRFVSKLLRFMQDPEELDRHGSRWKCSNQRAAWATMAPRLFAISIDRLSCSLSGSQLLNSNRQKFAKDITNFLVRLDKRCLYRYLTKKALTSWSFRDTRGHADLICRSFLSVTFPSLYKYYESPRAAKRWYLRKRGEGILTRETTRVLLCEKL